jgi:hypothetical protein
MYRLTISGGTPVAPQPVRPVQPTERLGDELPYVVAHPSWFQRGGMPPRLRPPEPAGYPSCEQGEPGLTGDKA